MQRVSFCVLTCVLLLFVGISGCAAPDPSPTVDADDDAVVLLVSTDGTRHDYPEMYDTPNLDRIAQQGTRADYIEMVFPTKTFSTHYTLVTGLYPSNHGIVSNNMYDPEMDASFSIGNVEAVTNPDWWDDGEPLWVTAEMQGVTAGTYFWPGSEAPIQGIRPTYWEEYDGSVPGEERVDTVLEWLDLPEEERPSFITLYFSEVDSRGHEHGPESEEVADAVTNVDGHIGRLLDGLDERDLQDQVNLIVTTDHGMAETSSDRVIILDDYIDVDQVHVVDYTPILMLRPDEADPQEVFNALDGAHPNMEMYWREDLPEYLHFDDHRRIPPIIGIADEGWTITSRDFFESDPDRFNGGAHGWDPRLPSMRGIFYAQGPAFQADHQSGPVQAINLYELMSHLLGLEPAPNDGSLEDAIESLDATVAPVRQ